ncbi:TPA: Csa1 family protein [Staphylococcus aureus]|nr:Csa1 family protein [Staphylococcus aureus]HEB0760406.1 Csa1 family protein [Staphylococcus aureus]
MMIHSKRLKLCLCLIILSVFIGACGMKKEESSKDKQIKENFNKTLSLYPTNKAPKLLIKGDGDLKGSSVGSKNLEFTFVENKEENIYFTDSVQYTPSEGTSYESN